MKDGRDPRVPRDMDELVTIWADDPAALGPAERARVEAHLASSPDAARDADTTRALLDRLRGLPATRAPEDLAREILRVVDTEAERAARSPWRWLRRGWRPALGVALAVTAAAVVVVARHEDRTAPPTRAQVRDAGVRSVPPAPTPPVPRGDEPREPHEPHEIDAPLALGVEGEVAADELDDTVVDEVRVALGGDDWMASPEAPQAGDVGLVPDLSLDWIDELDDADLDAVDHWLAAR